MRKYIIVLLALAVAALWAMPSFAGITGTSHELPNFAGPCANCHLPHGAAQGGKRLWPANATSGATAGQIVGDVAKLCAYCHNSGGTAFNTYQSAKSDTFVYASLSHGRYMSAAAAAIPRAYTTSGLDYHTGSSDGKIECTTCHNVHNDPTSGDATAFRPFLRADLDTLCAMCHDKRRFVSGANNSGIAASAVDAWGASYVGVNNPGSHPVGTDITGNYMGGNSPVGIPAEMEVAYDDSADGWDLGGHLTAGGAEGTGGVICVTCHAVHGIEADTQGVTPTITDQFPQVNYLAIAQNAPVTDTGTGRSIANGFGDFNALCEGCHTGTTPNAAAYPNVGAQGITSNPNPGGTAFGHPVDEMDATQNWVGSFPAGWPTGDPAIAGSNVSPTPICESCHVTHPNADDGRNDENATYGDFLASDYILRNQFGAVCNGCHNAGSATVTNHHPVGITYEVGTLLDYLTNTLSVGSIDTLSCGTCHGGGTGAHNWPSVGALGLDPSWKPSNNGRTGETGPPYYNAQTSITCMDCHYGIDGDSATMSPTKHDGISGESAYGGTIGQGTHYIGLTNAAWTTLGASIRGVAFDPEADTWPTTAGGVGGWSRWGGDATNEVMVCESCHELQPARNSGAGNHLLLGIYKEESIPADSRSDFCEGCHLPPGTHPMFGDTVSRNNNGLGGPLAVSTAKAWLDTPTDPNVIMINGNNNFSCDACHQPHDANSNSYTFILDTEASRVGSPTTLTQPTNGNYTSAYATSQQAGKGGEHQLFCNECHPYN